MNTDKTSISLVLKRAVFAVIVSAGMAGWLPAANSANASKPGAPEAFIRHVCTLAEVGVGHDGTVPYIRCVQPFGATVEFSTNPASEEIKRNRKLNIALIAKATNKKVSIGFYDDRGVDGALCVKAAATDCRNLVDISIVD